MHGRYSPDDPRSRGNFPADDPSQSNSWRQPDPKQGGRGGDDASGSQYRLPARFPPPGGQSPNVPRYVPGAQPSRAEDPRLARGGMPGRQPPARPARQASSGGARTDPALYEWDRLTQEQQRAVLATIGARGGRSAFPRRLVVAALVLLLILVVVGALYLFIHGL
jgi:hypothetical protein